MKVIVVASQKGGVGKTTLTGHLAIEAIRVGAGRVALIDTDPQQGLTGWWKARKANDVALIKYAEIGLAATLDKLRVAGIDLVLIDTPPSATSSIDATVALADLVIIPSKPSPHDLRAVGATVDIVTKQGKPMLFIVNMALGRSNITGEAAVALSQHGTVAPTMIHSRVDFVNSMSDGHVVYEMDRKSKSAAEITALWAYVATRFERMHIYAEAQARAS